MNISDLITALSQFPPDLEVHVDFYEGGFRPVSELKPAILLENVNSEYYYGPNDWEDSVCDPSGYKRISSLILR